MKTRKFRLHWIFVFITLVVFSFLQSPTSAKAQSQPRVGQVSDLDWSPDGTQIVTVQDEVIQLWDAQTGKLLASFPLTHKEVPNDPVSMNKAAWSPDSRKLVVAAHPDGLPLGLVIVVDIQTRHETELLAEQLGVEDVAWSPDGTKIAATLERDKPAFDALMIWDANTGVLLQNIRTDHTNGADALAWSPDSTQLAVGGSPPYGGIRIWDVASGNEVAGWSGEGAGSLAWSPDGKWLAVAAGANLSVGVFDPASVQASKQLVTESAASKVVWSKTNQLAVYTYDGVQIWDMSSDQPVAHLIAGFPDWSPDGTQLAAVYHDQIVIFDAAGTQLIPPPEISSVVSTTTPSGSITCPGTLDSRLVRGERARVLPGWVANLRYGPSTDSDRAALVPGRAVFFISDGPLCMNGTRWWRVSIDYTGQEGWLAEGNATDYWLEPVPASETSTDCLGAAPQRLQVGTQAKQALTHDPLIAKSDPTAADKLFFVNPGAVVDVVAGPLCYPVSGLSTSWWQVKNADGMTGWVAESGPTKYYFEPYPAS